jgi:hypothetical protein
MTAIAEQTTLEIPYYARPKGNEKFYIWEGRELVRVTHVLDQAPGHHLMPWYGKQAALKCASYLIACGILPPEPSGDREQEAIATLMEFCGQVEKITKEEAIKAIFDWRSNMIEAERYRDHKGRIGSVTHHALFLHAMGDRVPRAELEEYLQMIATDLRRGLWQAKYEKDTTYEVTEEMTAELARLALPYVLSVFEWIERAQPRWRMIGQEAMVVNLTLGYAGSKDWEADFEKRIWLQSEEYLGKWPASDAPEFNGNGDLKTSNSLADFVKLQLEAYENAEFIGLVADGSRHVNGRSTKIMALHCGPHRDYAEIRDEFGVLGQKAGLVGAKLYTRDPDPSAWAAFQGLLNLFNWRAGKPVWDQSRARNGRAEPKATMKDVRPAPFGRTSH